MQHCNPSISCQCPQQTINHCLALHPTQRPPLLFLDVTGMVRWRMIRWVAVSTLLSSDRHGWGRAESQRRNSGPWPVPSWQAGAGLSCPDLHLGAPGSLTGIVSKKEGLAAHHSKAKRPGWLKGKFALFQMLSTGGEGRRLSKGQLPTAPHPSP